MTQPESAGRIGISQTYVSDVEHGKFEAGAEIVIRIARFPPTPCFLLESVLPVAQRRRHCDCGTAEASHVARGAARRTRTDFTKEVPGVVAVAVPVVPVKAQSIVAHGFRFHRTHRCSQRSQVVKLHSARHARLPALGGTARRTLRAGTDGPQIRKAIMAVMSVLPFDIHTGAGCELHLDRLRFCGVRHDDAPDCNLRRLAGVSEAGAR